MFENWIVAPNILMKAGGAVVLLLAGLTSNAMEVRTAAQDGADPKFVRLQQGGKPQVGGLCVDIMRAIERVEPGITFVGDQSWQPIARIEAGVATGELDAACGLLRNGERESRYAYIDTPLFAVNYHLVVRADDNVRISGWDDVRKLGKQGIILVNRGFGVTAEMEREGGLIVDAGAADSKTNFAKLLAGRGRFFIHRSPGVTEEIIRAGMQEQVKVLPAVMYRDYFYLVVSKKLAAEVREKMNKAVAQIKASGELAALRKKWHADQDEVR